MRQPLGTFRTLRAAAAGTTLAATLSASAFVIGDLPAWQRPVREPVSLGETWRFQLGDPAGAAAPEFDDAAWSRVRLPHDWSIGAPRSPDAPAGMGGGYATTGTGWYRTTFAVPEIAAGRPLRLHFEGVYGRTEVWLNGRSLGTNVYGYSPFEFDVTAQVRRGAENVLAVRVDNSAQPNSRWYSGSGIFRDVSLEAVSPVHVATDGVWTSTESLTPERAKLRVRTTLRNTGDREQLVVLETRLAQSPGSEAVGAPVADTFPVPAGGERTVEQELVVESPQAWSPGSPALYALWTHVLLGKETGDVRRTRVGLRTVNVSPQRGFELNGRTIKLNGANVHHDHGPLGAAAWPGAEARKVALLKAAGFNAVRTAHNIPSTAFLDECDEQGLLVMDEPFDCWEKGKNPQDYSVFFKDRWRHDLDAMVRRDRRHPSVVMWSIGNEVGERGLPEGVPLARKLAARVRELDPTRPVTCGWNFPWHQAKWEDLDPMFAALDIAGYNYEHQRHADDVARVPGRVILPTESYQSDTFPVWDLAERHPYVLGDFVWSALDYLGESGIGRVFAPGETVRQHWEGVHWPWYGAYCGDIDLAGWRKPISHYRNIVWDCGEKLYLAVQAPTADGKPWQPTLWAMPPALDSWTWPGAEGRPLTVEVYSRHERVRLLLNGETVGEAPTGRAERFKAVFAVPYAPGKLEAVGLAGGKETGRRALETSGPAVGVRLVPDYVATKFGQSWPTYVVAEIVDAQGRVVPTAEHAIEFRADAGAEVLAVANGDLTSPEPYVAPARRAWHGRALVVVRPPAGMTEDCTVTATVPSLGGATFTAKLPAAFGAPVP